SNNSSYFSACSRASSILCGSFVRSPLRLLYTLEIFTVLSTTPTFPPPLELLQILCGKSNTG
uniref:Ovule protein n=1 Tax=Haemonchus contortus TaxID=6289 RepID=A0A7I4YMX7_HAECO